MVTNSSPTVGCTAMVANAKLSCRDESRRRRKTEYRSRARNRAIGHCGVTFGSRMHRAAVDDADESPNAVVNIDGGKGRPQPRVGHGSEKRVVYGANPTRALGIRSERSSR